MVLKLYSSIFLILQDSGNNVKGLIKRLIEDNLVWVLLLLFVVSLASGIIPNVDKLKSSEKSIRDEGIIGMLYIAGAVFFVGFLLGLMFKVVSGELKLWKIE